MANDFIVAALTRFILADYKRLRWSDVENRAMISMISGEPAKS